MIADEGQFYTIKDALLQTGAFTAHETEAIKLCYKHAIEIDLMPFGDIEIPASSYP
jgi:predicted nucleotidyltransferase